MNIGKITSHRKVPLFPFSDESKNTRVDFIYKIKDINEIIYNKYV